MAGVAVVLPQSGGEQNIILKLIIIFTWELPDIRVLPNCELHGGKYMYILYIYTYTYVEFLFSCSEHNPFSNVMWWKCKEITY